MRKRRRVVKSKEGQKERGGFSEEIESELLPLFNVMSIVKFCLPSKCPPALRIGPPLSRRSGETTAKKVKCSMKFQKLLLRCVSEFFHIVAIKLFQMNKRTFTDEDILQAMESLGINQYSTCLRVFMSDYRELLFRSQQPSLVALRE